MTDQADYFADTVAPDTPPRPPASDDSAGPRLGDGAIPADLDRFNASAFLWGAWWSLAYGIWPRFLVQAGLALVTNIVFALMRLWFPGWPSSLSGLALQTLFYAVTLGVNAWLALTANARAWEKAALRLSGVSAFSLAKSARGSVMQFRNVQKAWTRLGLLLWALIVAGPFVQAHSAGLRLSAIGSTAYALATFLVGVVAWLSNKRFQRMRRA